MKPAPAPSNEEARLASLRSLRILDSLPEQEYDDIVKLASAICGTPIALVSLIDEDRQWFKARLGLDVTETPRNVAFCAHAILEHDVFVVQDATRDERFADNPLVVQPPTVRFYAGAPLLSPEGLPIGTLCVIDRTPRHLSPEQKGALEVLSRQVTRLLTLRTKSAQLEEASARFRAAFDQNAVGLTVVGLDGRFIEVNRAFAGMLGYDAAELVGVDVRTVTHPDNLVDTVTRLTSQELAQVQVAKRFVRKDGSVLWTEAVGRRIADDRGHPLYWVSQVQDVTARTESEERLRVQYAMTKAVAEATVLADALPEMLSMLGAIGRWDLAAIWEVDPAEAHVRGLASRGITGPEVELRDVILRMRFARGEGVVGRAWETGQSSWVEDLLAHPNPTVVARSTALKVASMLAIPVRTGGAVVGIVHLISHRPRAFDANVLSLLESLCNQVGAFLARKRAQQTQQRMATMLESTSDLVAMASGTGRTLFLNRAARSMLEIPPDADPTTIDMRDFMPPDALDELGAELRALVAAGGGRIAGEFTYRSRSGRDIPVSQVVVVQTAPDGSVRFYATVARDISEAKKVERMKNEFVSTVSHELRTPLTSIRGALGLLEGGVVGTIDDEAREIVQIARANSDRLIRLINDMLDLDKIEAGKFTMDVREAAAEGLAASALDSVRGTADAAGVTLRSEVAPSLRVRVDVDRVVQVLTNLLSNATKFTPRGGTVTLRAARSGARVRFEVQDTGPGIAPELRARLFQKFEQLDASDTRAKGGTGLGLAISKAIVEQLGGSIGVESTPGTGSTFWFELDRATTPPPPARTAVGKATVLLVEDDASMRSVLGAMLERSLGLRVLNAPDGAIAVHLARTEAPDVVILDLGVPRPNGFEVVSILRDEASRRTSLVVYSGRELSSEERVQLTLGTTRFLTKGRASEQAVVDTVRELVAEREARP